MPLPDFSTFLEQRVLNRQYAGRDGITYNVIGLTNGPAASDFELHDGENCRPLNEDELQQMSENIRAALSGE